MLWLIVSAPWDRVYKFVNSVWKKALEPPKPNARYSVFPLYLLQHGRRAHSCSEAQTTSPSYRKQALPCHLCLPPAVWLPGYTNALSLMDRNASTPSCFSFSQFHLTSPANGAYIWGLHESQHKMTGSGVMRIQLERRWWSKSFKRVWINPSVSALSYHQHQWI